MGDIQSPRYVYARRQLLETFSSDGYVLRPPPVQGCLRFPLWSPRHRPLIDLSVRCSPWQTMDCKAVKGGGMVETGGGGKASGVDKLGDEVIKKEHDSGVGTLIVRLVAAKGLPEAVPGGFFSTGTSNPYCIFEFEVRPGTCWR
jgi:hypothetical protein